MITNDKIQEIEEKLRAEKKDLEGKIAGHTKTTLFGSEGEIDDSSPQADEVEEMTNDLSIAQVYRERLEEVENTLNKINSGKYGVCEKCGDNIEEDALMKSPTMGVCLKCRQAA